MNSSKVILRSLVLPILFLAVYSCKKPAGPGGRASVKGKVYVRDFDKYAYSKISEYYASGETVYISYGTNEFVGNDIKTADDGSFKFLYLNKGHYKVFANSRDTSIHVNGSNKTIPVVIEFDITNVTQTIDLGDLIINK
jgi:hypothetical protein